MAAGMDVLSNMRYCPETVIVQSACFFAEKITNLLGKKVDVFDDKGVRVVIESIRKVSKGLAIHGDEKFRLSPIERQALHCKLHFWWYKTWCLLFDRNYLDIETDLDGFPPLPRFGTGFFLSIVQHMDWDQLLVECLCHSPMLSSQLQEITSTILDSPTTRDTKLFALIFDNVLGLPSSEVNPCCTSSSEILLTTLASLCKHIDNQSIQVCILKKAIEYLFGCYFGTRLILTPLSSQELQRTIEGSSIPVSQSGSNGVDTDAKDTKIFEGNGHDSLTEKEHRKHMCCLAQVLVKLFTEEWTYVSHWTIVNSEGLERIDLSTWSPMHHWIIALYIILTLLMEEQEEDKKLFNFCLELKKYVDCYASVTEKEWVSKGLHGSVIEWDYYSRIIEESFDPTGCLQTTMFCTESIQDTLKTAIWRVNKNLPGAKDCFRWLLSTEEVFEEPMWLECIVKNASSYAEKEEVTLMIDVICLQRQILETVPGSTSKVFDAIKGIVLDVFKNLTPLDQDDIQKYSFCMSVLSGIDIQTDTIWFNPNHHKENIKTFLEKLQVTFNKLVDNSQKTAFQRTINSIRKMALVNPYIVIHKLLYEAVKSGHANKAIYQVLQEIPVLSSLSTNDSETKVLFEILSSLITSIKTKKEEKNLLNLIQNLLMPYKKENLPTSHQPLANITDLVQTCIIPHMAFKDDILLLKTNLKVLKSALNVLNVKEELSKFFIFKYLFPIILTLAKHLYACKVSWEGLTPKLSMPLPLAEVGSFRRHVLDVLKVSCNVIMRCFQGHGQDIAGVLDWLFKKLKDLDWITVLHLKELQDILPTKHCFYLPSCLIEICGLMEERWKPTIIENCDVFYALFQCCSVSESILTEIIRHLRKAESLGTKSEGLVDEITKNLCKLMSYFSWTELNRVIVVCKYLITSCPLDKELEVQIDFVTIEAIYDHPIIRTAYVLSKVLCQVFKVMSQPSCSSLADPVILGNMFKLYVNAVKSLCEELGTSEPFEKAEISDVIACIFTDICQVICLVPDDVTDPLFILALDVASNVGQRHADSLKSCVAKIPCSVYTDSLLQKISVT